MSEQEGKVHLSRPSGREGGERRKATRPLSRGSVEERASKG